VIDHVDIFVSSSLIAMENFGCSLSYRVGVLKRIKNFLWDTGPLLTGLASDP